jgi:meso-butanediol dehydrogenase/(S,S)-butanediol dehydrogenase/diacetyl reductase
MTVDLNGKRAMVVGAEFPAGGAIARSLAEAGADIALCALTPDEAVMRSRRVRRDVEALGRRATEYVMDVTLGRNVQVTTRQVVKEMGGLDIVVSAPDLPLSGPIERVSDTELARVLQVNFSAQFFVVRTTAEEFRRHGVPGRIVLVTSVLGVRSLAETAAYAAAHGAVHQLVRAAAEELRPDGIAINAITLGLPDSVEASDDWPRGGADEVGPLALSLVVDADAFVTGAVMQVTPGALG